MFHMKQKTPCDKQKAFFVQQMYTLACTFCTLSVSHETLCPQHESNVHPTLRTGLFYPLNYEGATYLQCRGTVRIRQEFHSTGGAPSHASSNKARIIFAKIALSTTIPIFWVWSNREIITLFSYTSTAPPN